MQLQMGAKSDVSICRISKNEVAVDGDLIVNGMSVKNMLMNVEDMEKRLKEFDKKRWSLWSSLNY